MTCSGYMSPKEERWDEFSGIPIFIWLSPSKDETAVYCLRGLPSLSVLVMFVSLNVQLRSISLAVYCLPSHMFWLIRSQNYIGSVYRMRSLAVSGFSFF